MPALILSLDGWQGLAIVVKLGVYITCLIVGGGVFFLTLFGSCFTEQDRSLVCRIFIKVSLAGAVFSLLRVLVLVDMLRGEWLGMTDLAMVRAILTSGEGWSLAVRLIGLSFVVLFCRASVRNWAPVCALPAAIAIPVSFGMVGHANELAMDTGWIPQVLIYLHLFAVTFWLGALWPLYRCACYSDLHKVAAVMDRFGKIAIFVVVILITAGVILLLLLLGSFTSLWQSPYGILMLVKLWVVAGLLFFAAMNKLRFTPSLLKGDFSTVAVLRKSIATEMVMAVVVLFVTASITTLVGPPVLN